MNNRVLTCSVLFLLSFLTVEVIAVPGCAPEKPEPVRTSVIADNEYEPANWGKVYPLEYESWLQTKEPRAAGKSKYKKGWDTDKVVYDNEGRLEKVKCKKNTW